MGSPLKYNLLERSIEYILHRTDNIIATAQRMLDATELLHPASQNPAKASTSIQHPSPQSPDKATQQIRNMEAKEKNPPQASHLGKVNVGIVSADNAKTKFD